MLVQRCGLLETYLERGHQLAQARELLREDGLYAYATALLAVHCAIALSDALLLQLTGSRGKNQDHSRAAAYLEKACKARKLETSGVAQLKALLSSKTEVSYGDKSVSQDRAAILSVASERFQRWAYTTMGNAQ